MYIPLDRLRRLNSRQLLTLEGETLCWGEGGVADDGSGSGGSRRR